MALQAPTLVARVVDSRFSRFLVNHLPVPLALARPFLLRDDARENENDGWGRLAAPAEEARYAAVRQVCERYARGGRLLDVGCSRGLLQEGLSYGSYVGIDADERPLLHASKRTDGRTSFLRADADVYEPDEPLDAIVFNEMLYYLPSPVRTVRRLAKQLAPGGVLVVSMYRAWATARIERELCALFPVLESRQVTGSSGMTWTITVYRPAADLLR
jgi:2-polyprenyl-3-methyl-5-hydroxy-6-metoxy-1,4-benzoquinol methylase